MGLFDLFRKKETAEIVNKDDMHYAFTKVKYDVSNINNWLNYLHSENKDAKNTLHELKQGHFISKTDIEHLKGWIDHFNQFNGQMIGYIKELNHNLGELNSHFSHISTEIEALKAQKGVPEHEKEAIKHELKAHITEFLEQELSKRPIEKAPEPISPPVKTAPEGVLDEFRRDLSISEKTILLELCKTEKGLTYKDLAILTNKSPNTVKNQINSIKNKGFPLKEHISLKGKVFYLEERLKKILLNS
ncbi:hypothetical protein JW968_05665 [Candidatus Woesearchaeota archaeon]|nr:hypothetical protein [Candidatus Woesearchaeota archaeon]